MAPRKISKPFLETWLKRTRKQLAGSGRISQVALLLAGKNGMDEAFWRKKIHRILEGSEEPDFDLLVEIDSITARPFKGEVSDNTEQDLFD